MNIYKNPRVKIFTFVIAFALFMSLACGGSDTPEKVGEVEEKAPAPTQPAEEPVAEDPTLQPVEEVDTAAVEEQAPEPEAQEEANSRQNQQPMKLEILSV